MKQYPPWLRRLMAVVLWVFQGVEERPAPCPCPHCRLERAKFETKRRKVAQ